MLKVERIKKDIETLAKFTSTPGEGVTRLAFTPAEVQAREYLKKEMAYAGLEISYDTAGNMFGKREGKDPDAPVVMFGSHIDSVVNGGAFDGAAGVVTALEIMRYIHEQGIQTESPLEMIVMTEEEGGRFGSGVWGSRAMAGMVTDGEIFEGTDREGVTKATALKDFGIDPATVGMAKKEKGEIKAFLELHIEQGPVLEQKGIDLGIVESIVGIRTYSVNIKGQADHAGTTPMGYRKDALVGAGRVISAIDEIPREVGGGTVATVGMLDVKPGGSNIVPGEVRFSLDVRSSESNLIEKAVLEIKEKLSQICASSGLEFEWEELLSVAPVKIDKDIMEALQEAASDNGISTHVMPSGAGHDAMVMASIAPVGMVFVPSKNGKSHSPEEWTDYDQIRKGAEVMLGAVLKLA